MYKRHTWASLQLSSRRDEPGIVGSRLRSFFFLVRDGRKVDTERGSSRCDFTREDFLRLRAAKKRNESEDDRARSCDVLCVRSVVECKNNSRNKRKRADREVTKGVFHAVKLKFHWFFLLFRALSALRVFTEESSTSERYTRERGNHEDCSLHAFLVLRLLR